eukprot:gnl/Dysnectes_brevis/6344_a9781_349.p1 GENE.gnl/Dysnectes_brevis/6344_a9781_349~~gnl/Dysnectes_brevis/6344_a9781_349.p1  ORF type:complete len:572 (+),score=53.09 gnl/Dysnectes_brevis/6344_a9781_349:58-1773(+)
MDSYSRTKGFTGKSDSSFIPKLVNRDFAISKALSILACQWINHEDKRECPVPALFGAPGIGKTAFSIHMLKRACSNFKQLKASLSRIDADLQDTVKGIAYLYLTGRELFLLPARESVSSFPAYIVSEHNSHYPGRTKVQMPSSSGTSTTARDDLFHAMDIIENDTDSHDIAKSYNLSNIIDSSMHHVFPQSDTDAKTLLGIPDYAPLPWIMFLDEIDKMDQTQAGQLLHLLHILVSEGRVLLFMAGNVGKTTTDLARESLFQLSLIRMHPIYQPRHVREMAAVLGIHQSRAAGYTTCGDGGGGAHLRLDYRAWSLFVSTTSRCGGIPSLLSNFMRKVMWYAKKNHTTHHTSILPLHSVLQASMEVVPLGFNKRYRPTPIIAAAAAVGLPFLPDDVIRPDVNPAVTVTTMEHEGTLYLAEYSPMAFAAVSVPPTPIVAVKPPPVTDMLGLLSSLECKPTSDPVDSPVSIICPAIIAPDLPEHLRFIHSLPPWIQEGGNGPGPGLRCEEEVAGLIHARMVVAAQLFPEERTLPFWRVLPSGVLPDGQIGRCQHYSPYILTAAQCSFHLLPYCM